MTEEIDQEAPARPQGLAAVLRRFASWKVAGVVLLIVGAIWIALSVRGRDADPYRTSAADVGEIARVVSATGALQPLVSVNVGSTVSGPVLAVEADFNSAVRAGQVLARIDPETFSQRVRQGEAGLSQALAEQQSAEADYARYAQLAERGFASEQLMSQQRAARARAAASVAQARAALAAARTDLERTIIRSPIDGVVVDRQVNPGQSVAASFQAPTLFVIAQDLARLQANITVDEADIGDVREGLPVRFTVDAFPGETFEAAVTQVRQQGANASGVVSYTVVVAADNPGRRLLPGMTANAQIVVEQLPETLRIPNAALRFRPADEALAARGQALIADAGKGQARPRAVRAEAGGPGGGMMMRGGAMFEELDLTEAQRAQVRAIMQNAFLSAERPGPDASPAERRAFMQRMRDSLQRQIEPLLTPEQREKLAALRAAAAGGQQTRRAVVWVLRDDKPAPLAVKLGVADDGFTAVVGGDLKAGDAVITGGGPLRENAPGGGPGGGPQIRIRG
jgi:HlyD family secretion protein